MTDKEPMVGLVAVTNVSLDGSTHKPGTPFEAPQTVAGELLDLGAAMMDDGGGDPQGIKGIGPKTAAALDKAGISGVADLARLSDDEAAKIAEAIDESAETVAGWRDQARAMVAE